MANKIYGGLRKQDQLVDAVEYDFIDNFLFNYS